MRSEFENAATERLILRPIRESDLEVVFTLHSDPELDQFNPAGPIRSLDEARKLLATWLDDWARHGVGYWLVERREEPGVVVGLGGVRHKELEGRQVLNLAYRFAKSTWGSGYATEVARAALTLARKHLQAYPVVAVIREQNVASIRVAERIGMRMERVIAYQGAPSLLYVDG